MAILVFDIETVPDIESGKKLYELHGLSDTDVAKAMFAKRFAKVGNDFLPHYLQKIAAISLVLEQNNSVETWSLGDAQADEKELITRFFAGIDKYTPTLVSWNGSGFDLPVLHFRALFHGVCAPTYWETGENHSPFRWNNYLNRFHYRHLDLMDILASYQNKAFAPLDELATMLGFPGKMGMSGDKVWGAFQQGKIQEIRDYCETDVLNTYCVFLRFELMRGALTNNEVQTKFQILKEYLCNETQRPHLQSFLSKLG